jgi:hypothetical protein
MPGKGTKYEAMARDAAERIEAARAMGQQMTFLPDEAGAPVVDTIEREAGERRVRGPGKHLTQMRDWLAAKGYRLPQDQLAQLAMLDLGEDLVLAAMQRADQIVTWAFAGATRREKHGEVWQTVEAEPTPEQRLAVFSQVLTTALRAQEALLPYVAPKVTPDVAPQLAVQVITAPAAPSGAPMRDVTPGPTRLADRRMVPADVRAEIERNQRVAGSDQIHSDAAVRTEGVTP